MLRGRRQKRRAGYGGRKGESENAKDRERGEEGEKERDGERALGLIYRRGVSVIISPSLSRSQRASSTPPVYPHPSGYRDRGRILAASPLRPSPRLGPASASELSRSGAPLNGRVVFQFCRRASFTIPPLLYCFRELPASWRTTAQRGGPTYPDSSPPVPLVSDFPMDLSSLTVAIQVSSLNTTKLLKARPKQSWTLMRYHGPSNDRIFQLQRERRRPIRPGITIST